nr:uncharacterized protein LOC113815650 [Penaeus vannamei]
MEGLEDLGCFYEDSSLRTWSQGRSYCQSIGGDLAVLDASADFLRVVDYYAAQTAGRADDSEWYGSEPNGSDLCVDLRNNYGFLLGDTGCTSTKMSLCKAP